MPDPQLTEYISKSRAAGMPDDAIRTALVGAGWPSASVEEALSAAASAVVPATVQSAAASPAKDARSFPVQSWRRVTRWAAVVLVIAVVVGSGYTAAVKFDVGIPPQVKNVLDKIAALIPYVGISEPVSPLPIATPSPIVHTTPSPAPTPAKAGLAKFASEEEFKAYLASAANDNLGGLSGAFLGAGRAAVAEGAPVSAPSAQGISSSADVGGGGGPARISETNVQVKGIDEPDIVKTDGKQIYFSQRFSDYPYQPFARGAQEVMPEMIAPASPEIQRGEPAPLIRGEMPSVIYPNPTPVPQPPTNIFKAFPPADLAKIGAINKQGSLLLAKNILMVLPDVGAQYRYAYGYGYDAAEYRTLRGYDVANPSSPKEVWKMELKEQTGLVDARLANGKLYLITSTGIAYDNPCPIVPLLSEGVPLSIPCMDVYHPIGNISVDATFTAMAVDPATGKVEHSVSIVGSSSQFIFSMSPNALYLTYVLSPDLITFAYNFFNEKGGDLLPAATLEKLRKLMSYDLSDSTKLMELAVIFQKYYASLEKDERLRMENELANRGKTYLKEHARELGKTAIVKIGVEDFSVKATGEVPGALLNQFSLDEYKNHLRVATIIGGGASWWGFVGLGGGSESENDVYVLDENLKVSGSVLGLGLTERIYSVRFVEDKGYVVTFRQVDPFYVLDLSDPAKPERKGELKIPGFSSYLHPINKDLIIGVGQESSQVKLSLFDVSDPTNPVEKDKYNLNEYWTEVSQTHHAFLLDDKHKAFFMPGSKGGYIFTYSGNVLKNVAAVADINAERAVYLDDYLYVIANNKIVVFNENDWQKVNQLEF